MKVIFVGAYNVSEVVLAPIKVGRELFEHISSKDVNSVYLCYFDDGSKYTRIQKLFGFEKISDRVYRCGIFPFILFTIKFKPDLIQIVTPDPYYLLLYPLKAFLKYKVAYLSHSIISYNLKNFLELNCYRKLRFYLIEKIVYRYSDLLQMLSATEAKFVTRYLKVKSSKIRIVNNGINMFGYKKFYNESSELIKIICIGSLKRKEKSFELLFEALSKINNPVQLSIFDYEEQKLVNLKLPANVQIIFGKPLNEANLREEFCKNDLFIIPSRYETFSLSLLEAMETGILFIATDRVGLTSRFPDSFNKFLVPYGNAEKLKDKILELHNLDCDEKNSLAKEIKNFAHGFSWDRISNQYIKLYTALSNR
jgi:glycosyltransferase involved in cell wall biosynthesis